MRVLSIVPVSVVALAVAGLAGYSASASAASQYVDDGSPSASAALDFRVNIPRVLYLQVGTGSFGTSDGTVDLIDFDLSAADVLDYGNAIAATAASGDLGGGQVTVRVFGNNGAITLASTTSGPNLSKGNGGVLPWSQILVTSTAPTVLPHPGNGGHIQPNTSTVNLAPTSGARINDRQSSWTFSYANSGGQEPGEYTGRVTYTASMP